VNAAIDVGEVFAKASQDFGNVQPAPILRRR
jgi:hypothetical protein